MARRPYVVLSAAMSADGCLDDGSPARLVLSGPEDAERVDELRAGSDAILVGAHTVRLDDPALLVRSRCRQLAREESGKPANPVKVTLSRTGDRFTGTEKFFGAGDARKLVFVPQGAAAAARARLGGTATVIAAAAAGSGELDLAAMLTNLAGQGIGRMLVEGGSRVLSQFLAAELADELQLAIAPFVVAEAGAPRLVLPGSYPQRPGHRMKLASVHEAGDMAVLRYLLGPGDSAVR